MSKEIEKRIQKIEETMEQFETSVKYLDSYQKDFNNSLNQIKELSNFIDDVRVSKDKFLEILEKTTLIYGSIQVLEPQNIIKEMKALAEHMKKADIVNFVKDLNGQVKKDSQMLSEKVINFHNEFALEIVKIDKGLTKSIESLEKFNEDAYRDFQNSAKDLEILIKSLQSAQTDTKEKIHQKIDQIKKSMDASLKQSVEGVNKNISDSHSSTEEVIAQKWTIVVKATKLIVVFLFLSVVFNKEIAIFLKNIFNHESPLL